MSAMRGAVVPSGTSALAVVQLADSPNTSRFRMVRVAAITLDFSNQNRGLVIRTEQNPREIPDWDKTVVLNLRTHEIDFKMDERMFKEEGLPARGRI
jgi:hypothetical protein